MTGCFFCIESVLYTVPPGGGIETRFNLLLRGALKGELEFCCADLSGDGLTLPLWGGLKMTFPFEAAFLIGRSGDDFFGFDAGA
jgi:hypothetical protein